MTICREINTVRFLASFFIKNYQKSLLPLVALSKTLQENKERLNIRKFKSNTIYRAMSQIASDLSLEEQEDDIIEGVENLLKRMEEIKNEESESDPGKHRMNYGLESPLKDGIPSQAESTMRTRSLVSKGLEMEMNSNLMEALAKVSSLVGIKSMVPGISNARSDLDFSYINEDIFRAGTDKSPKEEISINNLPPQPISNGISHKLKKRLRPRTTKVKKLSVQQ